MSLFKIFDISSSGMTAQNQRLNLIASNMANANSVASSPEEAYKSRQAVFSTIMENMNKGAAGVKSLGVVESQAEHPMRYEPGNPLANEEGYVFGSNVDTIEEMANMISASRSYQNNIDILNTSKRLLIQTLKLGE